MHLTKSLARRLVVLPILVLLAAGPPEAMAQGEEVGWHVVDVFSVGLEEDGLQFGGIPGNGIAVLSDGSIGVLDATSKQVVHLSGTGGLLAVFGREGQGPGELRNPSMIAGVGDSHLAVVDMGNERIVIYPTGGDEPTSVRWTPLAQGVPSRIAGGESAFIVQAAPFPVPIPGAGEGPSETTLLRLDLDGTLHEVAEFPGIGFRLDESEATQAPPLPPVFAPELLWSWMSSEQIAVARSNEYSVNLLDVTAGNLTSWIRRDIDAPAVPEAVKEAVREGLRDRYTSSEGRQVVAGMSQGQVEALVARLRFAPSLPLLNTIIQGPSGSVLVSRGLGLSRTMKVIPACAQASMAKDIEYLKVYHDVPTPCISNISTSRFSSHSRSGAYESP